LEARRDRRRRERAAAEGELRRAGQAAQGVAAAQALRVGSETKEARRDRLAAKRHRLPPPRERERGQRAARVAASGGEPDDEAARLRQLAGRRRDQLGCEALLRARRRILPDRDGARRERDGGEDERARETAAHPSTLS